MISSRSAFHKSIKLIGVKGKKATGTLVWLGR